MTKDWEKHRSEIIELYGQYTLEVVMQEMSKRRQFNASRRSYMEYLAKWGVRKYKRKGQQGVVQNERDDGGDDGAAAGEHAGSPSSRAPSQSIQPLEVPYTSHSNHTPAEAPHSLPADHQHQHQGHVAAQGWEYFQDAWPVQETSMQEYDPNMDAAQQYLAATHQSPSGVSASHHGPTPAGDSKQAGRPS